MAPRPTAMVAGHISLDVIPLLDRRPDLAPGRLTTVGPPLLSVGGAVGNTGLALHRLGVAVRLVARIGADPFGGLVRDAVAAQEPSLAHELMVTPKAATSYSIVVSPPETDRSFLHCPGANEAFSAADVPYDTLGGIRVFHLGYPPLMPHFFRDGGASLQSLFEQVRSRGPATSLDLALPGAASAAARADWGALLERTLPFVDVFAPSLDELLFLLRRRDARLPELADELLALGAAVVLIKLGDAGLYLRTSSDHARAGAFCDRLGLRARDWTGRQLRVPCFEVPHPAGTTGAGDATIAGFLAALLRGESPEEAVVAATAVGACSVEAVDSTSGIPSWPAIAARVAAGWRHAGERVAA